MPNKDAPRRTLRRLVLLLGFLGLSALGFLGWQWMAALRVEGITLQGTVQAEPQALLKLAGIDTGAVLLDVDPALVADRVARHPWVEEARVTRLPTGFVVVRVRERTPVALALDAQGRPAQYLDGEGFAMPAAPGMAFDVPLLRGLRETTHPVRPVQTPVVRELLAALAALDPETDALISELELRGDDVWVHTPPVDARGSIPVRLGRGELPRKLATLRAFWHQAVLSRPDVTYRVIDLRFDSQVVTREE